MPVAALDRDDAGHAEVAGGGQAGEARRVAVLRVDEVVGPGRDDRAPHGRRRRPRSPRRPARRGPPGRARARPGPAAAGRRRRPRVPASSPRYWETMVTSWPAATSSRRRLSAYTLMPEMAGKKRRETKQILIAGPPPRRPPLGPPGRPPPARPGRRRAGRPGRPGPSRVPGGSRARAPRRPSRENPTASSAASTDGTSMSPSPNGRCTCSPRRMSSIADGARAGRRTRGRRSAGSRSPVTRQWPVSSARRSPGDAQRAPVVDRLDEHPRLRLQRELDPQPRGARDAARARPSCSQRRPPPRGGIRGTPAQKDTHSARSSCGDLHRAAEEVDPDRPAARPTRASARACRAGRAGSGPRSRRRRRGRRARRAGAAAPGPGRAGRARTGPGGGRRASARSPS